MHALPPVESRLKPSRWAASLPVVPEPDLTPAERRAEAWARAGELVALRLLRDEHFRQAVASLAPFEVARLYCPRPGQGRDAVQCLARWCVEARSIYPPKPFLVVKAQVSGWCAHSDEPVDKAPRFRLEEAKRGAEVVARYGARQCLYSGRDGYCGARIARDRARALLCDPHTAQAAGMEPSVRASDERKIWRSRASALEALGRVTWGHDRQDRSGEQFLDKSRRSARAQRTRRQRRGGG